MIRRLSSPHLLPLLFFSAMASARPLKVVVLQTSDVHGRIYPWDYVQAAPANAGLARLATVAERARKETPYVLLLDGGDTIQGSPLAYLAARGRFSGRHPMAIAMNVMKYDAMTIGNHEFNYGLDVLRRAEKDADFPWLSANTLVANTERAAFGEYIIKSFGGVKVGVLGLTTPNIPGWEPEENRPGLKWEDPVKTAKRLVPVLRGKEKCDAVIVLIHSGLEADPESFEDNGTGYENRVVALARDVPGVDLILTGHTHRRIPFQRVHGVPVMQPGRYGDVIARADMSFETKGKKTKLTAVTGTLLPGEKEAPHPGVTAAVKNQHEAAVAYMDEVIVEATEDFPARGARSQDTALLDLVNRFQQSLAKAQISMTAPLFGGSYPGFAKGPVRMRDLYGLYPYENQLVLMEVTGQTLKTCVEVSAAYFTKPTLEANRLKMEPNPRMPGYNFETFHGISYRIDPFAPEGSRVKDLLFQGAPLDLERKLTLVTNSYRAQGAGGYTPLNSGKVLARFPGEIRELLGEYLKKAGKIEPRVDNNWVVGPDIYLTPPKFGAPPPQGM